MPWWVSWADRVERDGGGIPDASSTCRVPLVLMLRCASLGPWIHTEEGDCFLMVFESCSTFPARARRSFSRTLRRTSSPHTGSPSGRCFCFGSISRCSTLRRHALSGITSRGRNRSALPPQTLSLCSRLPRCQRIPCGLPVPCCCTAE
jgi:hypothetical protein